MSNTPQSFDALNIGLLNIRSLRNKVDYIVELLNEFNLDLLCLTETWLLGSDAGVIEAALPRTHELLQVPRPPNLGVRGGGVALVYSRALTGTRLLPLELDLSSFEVMEVVTKRARSVLRVALIYRPGHPGTDLTFMEEFGFFLESFSTKEGKLLICGDFNYWVDDPSRKPYSSEFVRLLDINNLVNHVLSPTHVSGHTLDLVLSMADSSDVVDLEVLPVELNISDHSLILFRSNIPGVSSFKKTITFRKYPAVTDEHSLESVGHALNDVDSSLMSAVQLVDLHNSFFRSLFNDQCPEVSKDIVVRDDSPWFDASLVDLRRRRRRAERVWRGAKTESARRQYMAARSAVVSAVARRKRDYYRHQVVLCGGDQAKLSKVLGSLAQRRGAPSLPCSQSSLELASSFADFFSEKILRIRSELELDPGVRDFSVDLGDPPPVATILSRFEHIDLQRVTLIIKETKKTFCSLDPINVSKMESLYVFAAPFIKKVIDKCFDEDIFVSSEKQSLIHPLIKKKGLDQENMANYRPVSNLTFLSKIIERAMLDQLNSTFMANNIIPVHQSAYRKQHSTETALLKIYNDLVSNTCRGQCSLLVVLDLSAAFDTVDHDVLYRELFQCGVRDSALALLRSYLESRHQRVVVNGKMSRPSQLRCGVPQGSVLGPVLFLVYTRSLAMLLTAHGVEFHFYADDTQIYIRITNIDETKTRVTSLMTDIKTWMVRMKLKLNESKTEIMLVAGNLRAGVASDFGILSIGDSTLVPADMIKNLGVIFDPELSFKKQIDAVIRNCNCQIRNIYAIRKYLDKKCLHSLVYSLVISRIDYCNSLYIGLPNYLLRKLQTIMNRSARLIYSLPPRVPTTRYLIDLHWLPIKARIEFKMCLVAFKALKFGEPKYLSGLLVRQSSGSGVDLRSSDDPFRLVEPRAVSERCFAERSFSYVAPRLLNRLPVSLKELDSLQAFKSRLKTLLFARVYDTLDLSLREEYRI